MVKLVASLTIGLIAVFISYMLLGYSLKKIGVPDEINGVFAFFYIFMVGYLWTDISKWTANKLHIKVDFDKGFSEVKED